MAVDKKSFILYSDLITVVEKLIVKDRVNGTNNAGELFYHLLKYVNDQDPSTDNFIVEMAFEPIKQQLKRDLKKYETIREKRAEAGKKSAELRAQQAQQMSTSVDFVEPNPTSVNTCQQSSTNPTDNVNDNVSVNGNDTVNVNDINSLLGAVAPKTDKTGSKKKFGKPEFKSVLLQMGVLEQHADDWMKVRVAKRATFTESAINLLINECEKNNFSVADAVRICAEHSWQGFKYSWVQNVNNNGKTAITANQSRQQRIDEVSEFRVDNQQSIAERLQKHISGSQ
ncbi:DUF6291 domain-containing protein [Sphingobacterium yanglingense]|uniref:DUF6291 domain-containing protein n=1 Tax=Sphingobacterium yanglingense TaxID=1437280 RepID=A0A4R6WHA1_9SPHI|nr:DUF6291 domain-containing protein [Sphingobacterium yanglingense]TDQ79553.1 hypothetical protein CLV99_0996 [Sphingobacterium yanglingense]